MSENKRRQFLKLAGLLPAAMATGCKAGAAPQGHDIQGSAKWERPPKQTGNSLNLLVFVADTFRADNLEAYGSDWVQTPNLNRFAQQSIVFQDAYAEGLPTIPARRVLYTGRRIVPTYHVAQLGELGSSPGWHHLYHEDVTLSEVLWEAGYSTALIADLPHLQRPGRNFHRGYKYFEWIRGQETDYYALAPRKTPDFSDLFPAGYIDEVEKQYGDGGRGDFRKFLNQYTANRKRWLKNGDSIVEQTARRAIDWLKQNRDEGPFYLHIESFDPHEPWDPPADFLRKYYSGPATPSWPEPPYTNIQVPPEGVKRLRANYAGEASNVDHWFGKIVETLGDLGLADNTVVVFLSDHGALLGEQGQFAKGAERQRVQVTRIPLLVRVPGQSSAKVSGFVQHPDLLPTLLGRLNLKAPARATGQDLWEYVAKKESTNRDHIVTGFGWIASVRTPIWTYVAVWNPEKYTGTFAPQLYDVRKDPQELRNVVDSYPQVAKDLQAKLRAYIDSGWDITRGSFAGSV